MSIYWTWALNRSMKWIKQFASHFGCTQNVMVVHRTDKSKEVVKIRWHFHHVINIFPTVWRLPGAYLHSHSEWNSSGMIEVYYSSLQFTYHNMVRVLNYINVIGRGDNTLFMYIQGDNCGITEGNVHSKRNWRTMISFILELKEVQYRSIDELGTDLQNINLPISWACSKNTY